jgi:hypothetical protein
VASAVALDPEAERIAPFVFHLLPGAQEVAHRLASYLVDLPCPSSDQTLFGKSLVAAVHAVDRLGAVPWTTVNHLAGYPVFVGALIYDVTAVSQIRVQLPSASWKASDGPFLHHAKATPRHITYSEQLPSSRELVSLRVQILTHLISSTDLPRLAGTWRSILSPHDHAA